MSQAKAATPNQDTKNQPGAPAAEKPTKSSRSATEHLFRFGRVEADSVDEDDLTLQVAFSSETPVLRKARKSEEALGIAKEGEKYWELLSHRSGDADFSLLNTGEAPVLLEHDGSKQVGNVKRAKLSKDKIGRAVLQFDGFSEDSKRTYQQMVAGKRTGISFGYYHTEFIGDEGEKDGIPVKRIAFAADEITSTFRPADGVNAGVRRSAEGQWSCLTCGDMFDRTKLDENFECGCSTRSHRQMNAENKMNRAAIRDLTQIKVRSGESEISLEDVRQQVCAAAKDDDRFKCKPTDDCPNPISYCWVLDIIIEEKGVVDGKDVDNYKAVIQASSDYKFYEVNFTLDGGKVTLGEAVEVKPKTSYEPVSRTADKGTSPEPKTRSAVPPVDSAKSATADSSATNLQRNKPMPKTIAELKAENPELAASLQAEARSAVTVEVESNLKQRTAAEQEKISTRNKEITALAESYVKDHGNKWNGKPGEVFVVGERIRALQIEALNAPSDRSAAEVRTDFKQKVHEIITGARSAKNPIEAAHMPEELASRCSLGRFLSEAGKTNNRSTGFILNDGAEAEAHKEMLDRSQHYPGGLGIPQEGQLFPANMPVPVLNSRAQEMRRLQRDSLAQDFATAGALIAPQFQTPIELLRNKMALGNLGITIFSGVTGGSLVFPRLTAPTTSQSLAEGAALASYDQVFDQVRMSPKRIGSSQNYSRLALAQANSNLEAIIWDDHMTVNALRADYLGLNGTGNADEPVGILNHVGIGAIPFAGSAANAYKNIIAMETFIKKANINDEISYLTTSAGRGTLRITPAGLTGSTIVSGYSNAIWVGEQCVGRNAVDSQQVPNDVLIAIAARHLMMASWAGLSVILDTLTLAKQDKYVLTMNQYIDWALRHPQAVARSADSVAVLA